MDDSLPRVACICTVFFPLSHADVIVSKLLEDYTWPPPRHAGRYDHHVAARELSELPLPLDDRGTLRSPRVRVASLYLDQVPETDIGRAAAARAGVPIFPTIREALTLGGSDLAVDGILLIGEHGHYPLNERGQKCYPRRRFFDECVAVFRESGRVVPIYNDKHLAYSWTDAKWMYDTARDMGIPFMAGSSISSIPLAWRRPQWDLPRGSRLHAAMAVGYSGIEIYGFHTLEVLQCVVERRAGGETGVAAVQCLSGDAMWDAGAAGRWDRELLDAAFDTVERRPPGDPRELAQSPLVFLLEYRDGLRAAVCMLTGALRDLVFAGRVEADGTAPPASPRTVATRFAHHSQEPYGHMAHLLEPIQDLICTGTSPIPIERTLLTTGVLDRAIESHWRGGVRLETPELAFSY